MTRRSKLWLIATMVAFAMTVTLCWRKPRGYTYQGKTVEEWFKNCCTDGRENDVGGGMKVV